MVSWMDQILKIAKTLYMKSLEISKINTTSQKSNLTYYVF